MKPRTREFVTQEDLALLLCSTVRTIRNDVRELRDQGILVPTRGQMKDIGKGVSHKARIVEEYLRGYEYSEIEPRKIIVLEALTVTSVISQEWYT